MLPGDPPIPATGVPTPNAGDTREFNARMLRVERNTLFSVFLGLASVFLLITVGLQTRYKLPVLYADAVYVVVTMVLILVASHIYRQQRR